VWVGIQTNEKRGRERRKSDKKKKMTDEEKWLLHSFSPPL
jgi:hypothetical protein